MSERRELARGTIASFAIRAVGLALGVGIHLFIARIYGSAALGVFALATVVAYTAAMFGRAGTDRALVRFVAAEAGSNHQMAGDVLGRALSITLPLSLVLSLTLYLATPLLSTVVFRNPDLVAPLRTLALAIPFLNLLGAVAMAFQGLHRVAIWAFFQDLLPSLITLAILLSIAATDWPVSSPFLIPSLSRALAFGIAGTSALLLWRTSVGSPVLHSLRSAAVRSFSRVSGPMLATATCYWILGWADVLMLGSLADASGVGIYRVAGNFAMAVAFARPAVLSVAMPRIARAWKNSDRGGLERAVRFSATAGFGSTALVALPIMIFADPLLRLFGQEFAAGRNCLILLCLGQLVISACGAAGYILDMTGEEKALRRAVLIAAATNLLLNAFWIPRWGVTGAAAASLISAAVWSLLSLVRAKRTLGFWVGVSVLFQRRRSNS